MATKRTVSGNIICSRGHLLHQGCAHILKPVLQLYGFRHRDAILSDFWAAVALLYDHVAALHKCEMHKVTHGRGARTSKKVRTRS